MTMAPVFDAVCVGAHPDDCEIGMGATIAKMAASGKRVAIVDLTDGEPTPQGSVEIRAREAGCAAEILGVEVRRTLTQRNRFLSDTVDARIELAQVLRELRPRMLFLPYAVDAHPDHIAAAEIGLAARFYSKFTKTDWGGEPFYPPRVFRYMAVHMRVVAQPSFVIECAEHLPVKIAALRAYESQFGPKTSNAEVVQQVELMARMWGGLANIAAGEPFFALESVALATPDSVL